MLGNLKACSVVVIIDACYSGSARDDILTALDARVGTVELVSHDPARHMVITSANSTLPCGTHGPPDPGSYFTQWFVSYWMLESIGAWDALEAVQNGLCQAAKAGSRIGAWDALEAVQNGLCQAAKAGSPGGVKNEEFCCNPPSSVQDATWGRIKELYR
jgi:hypothetical protein